MLTEKDVLEEASKILIEAIHKELRAQGHYLTGTLERSITGTVQETPQGGILIGTALYYGGILNAGVTAARVPFGGRTGNGGTSKYIQALINYFMLRGLPEKEATRAAFATAMKQKEEGMPTNASSAHSNTGTRLNFIGAVRDATGPTLDRVVLGAIDKIVDETFKQTRSERL